MKICSSNTKSEGLGGGVLRGFLLANYHSLFCLAICICSSKAYLLYKYLAIKVAEITNSS